MPDPEPPPVNPWASPPAAALPGFGRPRFGRSGFGPAQGLLVVVGFFLVQTAVGLGAMLLRAMAFGVSEAWRAHLAHRPLGTVPAPPLPAAAFIAAIAIGGYALAALWARRYVLRRARERLHSGAPDGIGWCAAAPGAYPAAVALAVGSVAAAALILRLFPMPRHAATHTAFDALLAPGPMLVPAMLLIVLGAPLAEEFIFRGAAFAAFAGRWGAGVATVLVTLLFVLVHAPEKWAYPPGFLDVSLMALAACWVRLRYRSIRPAVLLHVLYNLGVVAAAALLH